MDGFAWRRWLNAREAVLLRKEVEEYEQKRLDRDRRMKSRLVAVAVGRDAEALRQSYPDRSRYLILPAEINPYIYHPGDNIPPRFNAIISLRTNDIYAPFPFRPLLHRFQAPVRAPEPDAPRYRVTLAVGRRHEPWLERVERLSP
jgi:hypothetical protein